MILKLLVISILLMAVITALMAIRILLKKNGHFPNIHIGGNRDMARRGIFCATTQDRIARKDRKHLLKDTLS
ncbi:hypothetical protein [Anaerophaga thermohalophila]|jgi:hypothetical protein|uniref:hypothetical protein n=1 Tax=Anaerophaga thermohalophila TaxID=177400 RepID=UPI000237C039|nr:hypothetical protein [Anaerophaga thermohalophila]